MSHMSNLALSMLNALKSPLAVTPETISSITAIVDNPRVLAESSDRAQYFVGASGEPLIIRFPALLDRELYGTRVGKYFDLYGTTVCARFTLVICLLNVLQVEDDSFRKLRAIYGLRSLPADTDLYLIEVLNASANALELLFALQSKKESTYEEAKSDVKVTQFYKSDIGRDCFTYLAKSNPLFTVAPDPCHNSKIGFNLSRTLLLSTNSEIFSYFTF